LHKSSTQLQKQIEDLLKFNTALTQDYLPSRVPVNLTDVIAKVVEEHKLAKLSRQIKIVTHLQNLSVDGDPEQLRVVVDNLVSNAIKYSPDKGTVSINLTRSDDRVWIDVQDQGPGIEPTLRAKVFEPFFQGPIAPRGPIKGTGLGLAISDRYVKLHQGTIDVINASHGAHMRVMLPMSSPPTGAR
jgi:two-component system sensor histidine kinase GlrK